MCDSGYLAPVIPGSDKKLLHVAQYNTKWLFIDYCSSSDCPGSDCPWEISTEAQTHLTRISNNIKSTHPDIMNMAEIRGCDEINFLHDTLDDSYDGHLIKGTDTSTGQNVGMIYRIDPFIPLYGTENKRFVFVDTLENQAQAISVNLILMSF